MKFKGILLDIDNCLYDYQQAHCPALNDVLSVFSARVKLDLPALSAYYEKSRDYIHGQLEGTASSHNRLLYFQRMFELMGVNAGPLALEGYNHYWDVYIQHMKLFDGVIDLLSVAKKNKTKICFVTDLTADIQHKKIFKLGLWEYTDALVTSEEVGVEKPHKEIFEVALKKIGLHSSDVCMIGDSYEKDIEGAVNLGIQAYWLNPAQMKVDQHPLIRDFQNFREIFAFLQ
jgi:putative hydrolase of the HAD superfamily